jgi:branched-subunit amino acid transport protein
MRAFAVVVAAGIGSYLLRISMLVIAARHGLPPLIARSARHAVPTAFAALAAGSLVSFGRTTGALAPLAAVVAAAVAVRRTGSPHAALLAGMPTLWVVSALVSG